MSEVEGAVEEMAPCEREDVFVSVALSSSLLRARSIQWGTHPTDLKAAGNEGGHVAFETVGGHADQWVITESTRPGYVCKVTSLIEAQFYYWLRLIVGHRTPDLRFPLTVGGFSKASSSNKEGELASGSPCSWIRFLKTFPPQPNSSDAVCLSTLSSMFVAPCISIQLPPPCQSSQMSCTCHRGYLVEMKNLLYGFRRPCVLDVKIGQRMYGDDASPEKKARMILKAMNSTSLQHGIRYTASKAYDINNGHHLIQVTRQEAASFTSLTDFKEAFARFMGAIHVNHRSYVAEDLLQKLTFLLHQFTHQKAAHFFSSSILIYFDNDAPDTPERTLSVRMIDFAHITFNPDDLDQGYIFGLESLRGVVEWYRQQLR